MGMEKVGTASILDFAQRGWERSRFIGTPSPDAPSLQNLPPAEGPPPLNTMAVTPDDALVPSPQAPATVAPVGGPFAMDVQAANDQLARSILVDVTHHTLLMHGEPVDIMDEEVEALMKTIIAVYERHQLSKVYALRNQFGVFGDPRPEVPAPSQDGVEDVLEVQKNVPCKKRQAKKESPE